MTAEVVGAIKRDRKPRTKLSLKAKVEALDAKIGKAEQRLNVLRQKRASMVAEARAALMEVESASNA